MIEASRLNKSALARRLGISRSSLYHRSHKQEKDWRLKQHIEAVLHDHPSYGHRRIALALRLNKKRIRRVMKKFGLKPYRRRGKRYKKIKDFSLKYPNLLLTIIPSYRHQVWVSDFTYLGFHGTTVYVGTVLDIWGREIVGVSVLTTHSTHLVIQALWNALLHHPRPEIFHSDNGAEYEALAFRSIVTQLGIRISRSRPRSPWENGYQESFYSQFKVELGDPNRFSSLGELVAEIYRLIHYYNTQRIHSALRMAPRQFSRSLLVS